MTSSAVPERRTRVGPRIPQKYVPILMTLALLASMFTIGSIRYPGFATGQVVLNVFIDNSFLLVVAIGMTFVILTGGIDLSVGAVVALSTLMLALLVKHGWPTLLAIVVVLVIGSTLGWTMGAVIHYFEIQPFIVTLAGMFLARGLCYAITVDAVSITKPGYVAVAEHTFNLPGDMYVTTAVVVSLVTVLVGIYVLHYTRLGRNVYAIGGNEQSALLMGLPVARTKIAVYTISGFCSALGGVMLSFYMLSGSGSLAVGMELDAIAAVVIGGTMLTGGIGYLAGTVLGVLVLGLIQTLINFQGTLSSWWTRIVIGLLLFAFHPSSATRLSPQEELARTFLPHSSTRHRGFPALRAFCQRDRPALLRLISAPTGKRSGSRPNQVGWSLRGSGPRRPGSPRPGTVSGLPDAFSVGRRRSGTGRRARRCRRTRGARALRALERDERCAQRPHT